MGYTFLFEAWKGVRKLIPWPPEGHEAAVAALNIKQPLGQIRRSPRCDIIEQLIIIGLSPGPLTGTDSVSLEPVRSDSRPRVTNKEGLASRLCLQ